MDQAKSECRQERRQLKQMLFFIRRFSEGEPLSLSAEHERLKQQYESHPLFTSWSGFPEKWDIGDPFETKKDVWGNDVDRRNFERALGKPYSEIILKESIDGTDY